VSIAGEWLQTDPTTAALVLIEVEDPANTRFAPRRLSMALNRGFVGAEYRHAGPVHSVAINVDGTRVLTTSGKQAMVWEARTGRVIRTLSHNETVTSGSFDPTGRFVVTRAGKVDEQYFHGDRMGNTAWVWEVKSGEQRFTLSHDGELKVVAFSPNGQFLVTGSDDDTAQLWDVDAGQLRFTLKHKDGVNDVSFSEWQAAGD
jgi:WD40 repeat protein